MKRVLILCLALAACGVQEKGNPQEQQNAKEAEITSAVWCAEDKNVDGIIDTYKFYEDGVGAWAEWNLLEQRFRNKGNITWSLEENTLKLTSQTNYPPRQTLEVEFFQQNKQTAMRWIDKTRRIAYVLSKCTLNNDPR